MNQLEHYGILLCKIISLRINRDMICENLFEITIDMIDRV